MKKTLLASLCLFTLAGCGVNSSIEVDDAIKAQPELAVKTSGMFWGLGRSGNFDMAGLYKGKYSRDKSSSTWLPYDSVSAEMTARVTNVSSNQSWDLLCGGGYKGVNFGGIAVGSSDPYTCQIMANDKNIGKVELRDKSGVIKMGIAKEVQGYIEMNAIRYQLESDHKVAGSFTSSENPLGFHVSQNGKRIAAIYTNGSIALQMQPNLSDAEKDVMAVATIASALSWRAESDTE
ncbi:hypothetical protein A3K86_09930 [Photobacterium jeanii]|uniref:Uncharacterized protein n=1 Tax=Photobacterium jeanii TaxID=858640 RepID=A0A178KJ71_9GAMM|nr:hypothetical protein [Photobacterium jeanii]OAN16754.1 hypothetical protein A3K86_09930 [Photobacterium jeanii]PST87485.1 hypothetical protein C9I91_19600 [Photobacterium jeanii]